MQTTAIKTKWSVDPAHSELTFRVKHLMITNVKGEFRKFTAVVESSGTDFSDAKIRASAETDSIDTNNSDRDVHLRSADFFDAAQHKKISFEGKTIKRSEDKYQMEGQLTIKGVSKPVNFNIEFGGFVKDPYGNEKAGFSFDGKISRKDFGLHWNAALETGGVMVSDEVKIQGDVQLIREK